MLDIEVLRLIWWILLGVLFIGFAVTDGFDFGVAMLLPLLAKNENERRVMLYSIGPFWEGNQVWIILGAGAIFAAWPYVYAVSFSGFYLLILLLLLTMGISRPVSFKYRDKLHNPQWRAFWDWGVFIGGLVPAFIFGFLIGNTLQGVPFYFDDTLRMFYTGHLSSLFNPFAIWCGFTSMVMLCMHGAMYLVLKTYPPLQARARVAARIAALLLLVLFVGGGFWINYHIIGYQVASGAIPSDYSNPLHKLVTSQLGAWMHNYDLYPVCWTAPLLGILGALGVALGAKAARLAFCLSGIAIIGVISTVGISMFPFILPSSADLNSSLLVWDASSSYLTLLMMFCAVVFFMPLILIYTSWVYYALGGKVDSSLLKEHDKESH